MLDETRYMNQVTQLTPTDCASWQTECDTQKKPRKCQKNNRRTYEMKRNTHHTVVRNILLVYCGRSIETVLTARVISPRVSTPRPYPTRTFRNIDLNITKNLSSLTWRTRTKVAFTSALAFYRQPTCIGPRALEERKLNSKTDSSVFLTTWRSKQQGIRSIRAEFIPWEAHPTASSPR